MPDLQAKVGAVVGLTVFQAACRAAGLEAPEAEYRFHPTRKWKFDWAFPAYKVAVEIEGAVWTQGRHTRGVGFVKDIEKYNEATILGWRVLRCTVQDFENGTGLELVMRAVEASEV